MPDGTYAANITEFPGSDSGYGGRFVFQHDTVTSVLDVTFALTGVPESAQGMFHIHEGSTCWAPGRHLSNSFAHLSATINRISSDRRLMGNMPLGKIEVTQEDWRVTGKYKFTGLPADSEGGFHIHDGESCASVTEMGGHLMNTDLYFADITPMPGYTGNLVVSGHFGFTQRNNNVLGRYFLNGLDPSTTGMFHVHTGSSCASPGAHLMNTDAVVHTHQRRLVGAHDGHDLEDSDTPTSQSGTTTLGSPNNDGHEGTTANAKCVPCVAGISFSDTSNAPRCKRLTPCKVGFFETVAGTSTTDRTCSPCTNGPAHSYYTSAGSPLANDCAFRCYETEGYSLTNAGTECASKKQAIKFKTKAGQMSSVQFYNNGVLKFNNFKCIEQPHYCGDPLARIEAEIADIKDRLKAGGL
jgi:Cu/Zn superoxide dismutase